MTAKPIAAVALALVDACLKLERQPLGRYPAGRGQSCDEPGNRDPHRRARGYKHARGRHQRRVPLERYRVTDEPALTSSLMLPSFTKSASGTRIARPSGLVPAPSVTPTTPRVRSGKDRKTLLFLPWHSLRLTVNNERQRERNILPVLQLCCRNPAPVRRRQRFDHRKIVERQHAVHQVLLRICCTADLYRGQP
jgi:hypothetical protein